MSMFLLFRLLRHIGMWKLVELIRGERINNRKNVRRKTTNLQHSFARIGVQITLVTTQIDEYVSVNACK